MKRTSALFIAFLVSTASAIAADVPPLSPPDANPACMERNGPDCTIKSEGVPRGYAAPQNDRGQTPSPFGTQVPPPAGMSPQPPTSGAPPTDVTPPPPQIRVTPSNSPTQR